MLPVRTQRLTLRPFQRSDAEPMLPLIGDFAIADTTCRIPHPYTLTDADAFLSMLEAEPDRPIAAVTITATGQLIGAVGLAPEPLHDRADLGYWIGRTFWNRGYATEAARAMIGLGFGKLGLNKITAHYFLRNPASGRVLEKLGMRHEGVLRQHLKRWDRYEDCGVYGITREEFLGAHHGSHAAAEAVG